MAVISVSFMAVSATDKLLIWNADWVETLELDNLLARVNIAINSAASRSERLGGHANTSTKQIEITG